MWYSKACRITSTQITFHQQLFPLQTLFLHFTQKIIFEKAKKKILWKSNRIQGLALAIRVILLKDPSDKF